MMTTQVVPAPTVSSGLLTEEERDCYRAFLALGGDLEVAPCLICGRNRYTSWSSTNQRDTDGWIDRSLTHVLCWRAAHERD